MKTILITGANAGIGLAAALSLAKDHRLILLCRSLAKAEEAKAAVLQAHPQAEVDCVAADLADLPGVARAADEVLKRHDRLDVLLNNAGYLPTKVNYINGVEETLYSSHLGHMLLTLKLMPLLEASADGRVVNVSSEAHRMGSVRRMFSEVRHSSTIRAYGDAKLANALFARALAERFPKITAYSLHPGVVRTQFSRNLGGVIKFLEGMLGWSFYITPEQGALTSIHLCTAPLSVLKPHNGGYFAKQKPSSKVSRELTSANAAWLWEKSIPYLQGLA